MTKRSCSLFLMMAIALGVVGAAHATVINGDFSAGLDDWVVDGAAGGDVTVVGEVAVLGDVLDWDSMLYQGIAVTPGIMYLLEFDVQNQLSETEDWPDTFFASLYFVNNMSTFDPWTPTYDGVDELFSMDPDSFFDVFVELDTSALGAGWTHVSYMFDADYDYAIPLFELFDSDLVVGNSTVGIDNVSMSVVPEPATVLSLGCLLAGMAAARKLRPNKTD